MRRKELKQYLITVLEEDDLQVIKRKLVSHDTAAVINALISVLCHTEERVKWHGVFLLAELIDELCKSDMESGRTIMRRFLWMLNDESGGIGWGIPEAMSETMARNSQLASEYLHMMVSYALDDGPELFQDGNFLELPLLQQGVLWGLCRLAKKYPAELKNKGVSASLPVYLRSPDSQVRGMACRLCGLLLLDQFIPELKELTLDSGMMSIVSPGGVQMQTVGDVAKKVLEQINYFQDSSRTPGNMPLDVSEPRR